MTKAAHINKLNYLHLCAQARKIKFKNKSPKKWRNKEREMNSIISPELMYWNRLCPRCDVKLDQSRLDVCTPRNERKKKNLWKMPHSQFDFRNQLNTIKLIAVCYRPSIRHLQNAVPPPSHNNISTHQMLRPSALPEWNALRWKHITLVSSSLWNTLFCATTKLSRRTKNKKKEKKKTIKNLSSK